MSSQADLDATAGRLFQDFLRRTHLSTPAELPGLVASEARAFGGEDVVLHLIDYEQEHLVPLGPLGPAGAPVTVEGTVLGRAFAASTVVQLPADAPGRRRLVLPLLDGTDRLGTLQLTVGAATGSPGSELGDEAGDGDDGPDGDDDVLRLCERYAHLVAQALVSKSAYGDAFELARRTRPMDVSAELVWRMLPPTVFATERLVVAGLLEPCYASGGDCFDYAVNGSTAHLAIFDAMGHGLPAAGAASFAVSAYRSARRRHLGLVDTYAEMDGAIAQQSGDRHVTAVLAELDLDTGHLRWVSAGHPAPLLLRDGRVVKALEAEPQTPLGIPFVPAPTVVAEESLQPGDAVLLFTDGLPEARLPDGEFFTVERLGEFVERQAAAGHPAPETLRRLRHAVLRHQRGQLQDDATALLVEWRRGSERALLPPTV
jgi:hypothetical protein